MLRSSAAADPGGPLTRANADGGATSRALTSSARLSLVAFERVVKAFCCRVKPEPNSESGLALLTFVFQRLICRSLCLSNNLYQFGELALEVISLVMENYNLL